MGNQNRKGKFHSEETKARLAEMARGNTNRRGKQRKTKVTEAERQAISERMKGESNPAKRDEVRAVLSEQKKGENNHMFGRTGEAHPNFGVKRDDEFRENLSRIQKEKAQQRREAGEFNNLKFKNIVLMNKKGEIIEVPDDYVRFFIDNGIDKFMKRIKNAANQHIKGWRLISYEIRNPERYPCDPIPLFDPKNFIDPSIPKVKTEKPKIEKTPKPEKPIDTRSHGEKWRATMLAKRGCLSTKTEMTAEEKRIANEKREATNLERYGVKNAFQSDEKKEKIKQTNLERYGVESSMSNKNIREKMIHNRRKGKYSSYPEFADILTNHDKDALIKLLDSIDISPKNYQTLARTIGIRAAWMYKILNDFDVLDQYRLPLNYSSDEESMKEYLDSIGVEYVTQKQTLLTGRRSLDFIIHDGKLAIEMDGIYHHGEIIGEKDKTYHLSKTTEVESHGYQLLHIFSNEWNCSTQNQIWKSIIHSKLNLNETAIDAKTLGFRKVGEGFARPFLLDTQLEPSIESDYYLEFYDKETNKTKVIVAFNINKRMCVINAIGKILFTNFINLEESILDSILFFHSKVNHIEVVENRRYIESNKSTWSRYSSMTFIEEPKWWGFLRSNELFEHEEFMEIVKSEYSYDETKSELENLRDNRLDRVWDVGHIRHIIRK